MLAGLVESIWPEMIACAMSMSASEAVCACSVAFGGWCGTVDSAAGVATVAAEGVAAPGEGSAAAVAVSTGCSGRCWLWLWLCATISTGTWMTLTEPSDSRFVSTRAGRSSMYSRQGLWGMRQEPQNAQGRDRIPAGPAAAALRELLPAQGSKLQKVSSEQHVQPTLGLVKSQNHTPLHTWGWLVGTLGG